MTTPAEFPAPLSLPRQYLTTTPDSREVDPNAWEDEASCAQIGGDAWFPEKGGDPKPAQRICNTCPVAAQCLQYALDNRITFGLWGGVPPKTRARMLNRRAA